MPFSMASFCFSFVWNYGGGAGYWFSVVVSIIAACSVYDQPVMVLACYGFHLVSWHSWFYMDGQNIARCVLEMVFVLS